MTDAGQPTTPPGWHTDPGGSGQLRWWSGSAWTEHLAPVPSAVPEPVEPAYVPFSSQSNSGQDGRYATSVAAARPVQWNTAASWALAISPVIGILAVVGLAAETTFGFRAWWWFLAFALLPFLWCVAAVQRDRRKLRMLGYQQPPSALWVLLAAPLAYLIARTVRVRSESGRGSAPLWTYLGVSVAVGVAAVFSSALFVPILVQQQGSAIATALASQIQTGMNSRGGNYQVSCPPTVTESIGSKFTCTAIDNTTHVSHSLLIDVVADASGKPTLKLESVTPPIG